MIVLGINYDYIKDIIRSGLGEKAALVKRDLSTTEWGDYEVEDESVYEFITVFDSMERSENEQDPGDFIEGDVRFYVSSNCDVVFENGDIIRYAGREYNVTSVNRVTLGPDMSHKVVFAENV